MFLRLPLLFALMMTRSKENQVTLYSDKVPSRGHIKEKVSVNVRRVLMCVSKERKMALLYSPTLLPVLTRWLSPMEATLNTNGSKNKVAETLKNEATSLSRAEA